VSGRYRSDCPSVDSVWPGAILSDCGACSRSVTHWQRLSRGIPLPMPNRAMAFPLDGLYAKYYI
jgi:hypothetical protein